MRSTGSNYSIILCIGISIYVVVAREMVRSAPSLSPAQNLEKCPKLFFVSGANVALDASIEL